MRTPPDPDASKAKTKQLDLVLIILLTLVVGGAVFQFFLRYTYVRTSGNGVVRVDRVSGDSCTLPCSEGGYTAQTVPYVPVATPIPAKICHPANVVRVAKLLQPPVGRTPTPFEQGGARSAATVAPGPQATSEPTTAPPAVATAQTAALAAAKAAKKKVHAHPRARRHGPRGLPDAVELSDGHVYVFSRDVFAADITTWTTGQDVQVCTTWSKLENRPYYSVGASDDAQPAILAL